jgi:hypothetical protein
VRRFFLRHETRVKSWKWSSEKHVGNAETLVLQYFQRAMERFSLILYGRLYVFGNMSLAVF